MILVRNYPDTRGVSQVSWGTRLSEPSPRSFSGPASKFDAGPFIFWGRSITIARTSLQRSTIPQMDHPILRPTPTGWNLRQGQPIDFAAQHAINPEVGAAGMVADRQKPTGTRFCRNPSGRYANATIVLECRIVKSLRPDSGRDPAILLEEMGRGLYCGKSAQCLAPALPGQG
jgi:hypothetical protein